MATTARALFSAHVDGLQVESIPFQFQWSLPNAILKREVLTWNGDQTLTIPSGCTLVIINPPVTTTATLILKGLGADTGWQISSTKPTIMTVLGAGAKIITSSGPVVNIELTYL